MVVREQDGEFHRYESTLDGDNLMDEFVRWAKSPIVQSLEPKNIGAGDLDVDKDGECEQEYGLLVDYQLMTFLIQGFLITREVFNAIQFLTSNGWKFPDDLPEKDQESFDKMVEVLNFGMNP